MLCAYKIKITDKGFRIRLVSLSITKINEIKRIQSGQLQTLTNENYLETNNIEDPIHNLLVTKKFTTLLIESEPPVWVIDKGDNPHPQSVT